MWEDLLELILLIFDDMIGFLRHGWKNRKGQKKRREEAEEIQRQADRNRPL